MFKKALFSPAQPRRLFPPTRPPSALHSIPRDAPFRGFGRSRSVERGLLSITHHVSPVTSSKSAARTKLGAKRAPTRWGRAGVKGDFFNILLDVPACGTNQVKIIGK